jgi:hypothetical protein
MDSEAQKWRLATERAHSTRVNTEENACMRGGSPRITASSSLSPGGWWKVTFPVNGKEAYGMEKPRRASTKEELLDDPVRLV